jgi:hypothetical protein
LGFGEDMHLQLKGNLPGADSLNEQTGSLSLSLRQFLYAGKTWGDFGTKKQPNPWVTLRALRVLKSIG